MIEPNNCLPLVRQTQLLSVSKSSFYHKKVYTQKDLAVMNEIDVIYTEHMYYGSRRISKELQKRGFMIGRKKTRKYMQIMGLCAIYPPPKTSIANKDNEIFPYLLRDKSIVQPNEVRSIDITYIKIQGGFVYLVAIIDWYSRYIVSRDVGTSMDKELCIGVLKKALRHNKPEIFNTDQGSQFTSKEFTSVLQKEDIHISMDGKGRRQDNIPIERLWRTIKYEDIHINEYQTPNEVYHGLNLYIDKYNNRRLHSALDYKTPAEIYHQQ